MLKRGWGRWRSLIGAAITAAATAISGMLSAESLDGFRNAPANIEARSGSPIWAFVSDYRVAIIGLMVVVAVAPSVWSMIYAERIREKARLELMKRYLNLAQRRTFPDADGINSRARVSLYVPRVKNDEHALHCVYRTDGTLPSRSWKVTEKFGFVVRAWREQTARVVEQLKTDVPEDRARYLQEAWCTEEIMKKLTWPGAAMIAVPITVRPGADPDAVFLVETVGIELAQQVHEWDAAMCTMLLEDR